MLKLARYNKGMRSILHKTKKSLRALGSFSAVLLLFLFVWALMGMDLFAYQMFMNEEGELITTDEALALVEAGSEGSIQYPRQHFNDIFNAHISVYSLTIGEDWPDIMFNLVLAMDKNGRSTLIPKFYCIIGIIFGNFTLLALFTGTLL